MSFLKRIVLAGALVLLSASAATAQDRPSYSIEEIEGMIRNRLPDRGILERARESCVDFALDADNERRLRQAGADLEFIRQLRQVCVRPRNAPAPPEPREAPPSAPVMQAPAPPRPRVTGNPSGSPQVGVPSGGFQRIPNAQVGRAYLVGDSIYGPTKDNLPFGVILLKRAEVERNRAVCSSFVNNIASVEDIRAAAPATNIIATYWMLTRTLFPEQLADCDALLANYNYARAQRILSGYGKATSAGPVFLALRLNSGLGIPADVFLLDLSRQSPDTIAQITIDWFNVVVSSADDQAAVAQAIRTDDPPARTRGRGFFRRVLAVVGSVIPSLGCDVLTGRNAGQQATYTNNSYADPFLNNVRGTLQVVAHGNAVISAGAHVLADLLCPSGASPGPVRRDVRPSVYGTFFVQTGMQDSDRRDWYTADAAEWVETRGDGIQTFFRAVRREVIAGATGTVVAPYTTSHHQGMNEAWAGEIFIPDAGQTPTMYVRYRSGAWEVFSTLRTDRTP